jgi:hypothetical protein
MPSQELEEPKIHVLEIAGFLSLENDEVQYFSIDYILIKDVAMVHLPRIFSSTLVCLLT